MYIEHSEINFSNTTLKISHITAIDNLHTIAVIASLILLCLN